MEFFTNSEWAAIIWSFILLFLAMCHRQIRKSIFQIFRAAFPFKLSLIYLTAILYYLIVILFLYTIGFWKLSILKATILWILSTGAVMICKIISLQDAKGYIVDTLKEAVKWTIIFEFIIGLHSFSFWFEFILLPIILFISILSAYAEVNNKNLRVIKFFKNILFYISMYFVVYKLLAVFFNYELYADIENLREFILGPILILLFIPVLCAIFLLVKYETVFLSVKYRIKDPNLYSYAFWQTLLRFNINSDGLIRWKDSIFNIEIANKNDITKSISKIRSLQRIEKNPPYIDKRIGWSPYEVKDYLKLEHLKTGYYKDIGDNEWFACSEYLKLGDEFIDNNIAYYINGNENVAKSLKLVLNINHYDLRESAHYRMLELSNTMYKKVFNIDMSFDLMQAILNGTDYYNTYSFINIALSKRVWKNRKNGYDITFELSHNE